MYAVPKTIITDYDRDRAVPSTIMRFHKYVGVYKFVLYTLESEMKFVLLCE